MENVYLKEPPHASSTATNMTGQNQNVRDESRLMETIEDGSHSSVTPSLAIILRSEAAGRYSYWARRKLRATSLKLRVMGKLCTDVV